MVVDPLRLPHKITIILLHGRGANASLFGPPLLSKKLPSSNRTFRQALPHAKFIFPDAPESRAVSSNGILGTQWFELSSPLTEPTPQSVEELMCKGLKETCIMLHHLLRREIEVIGAQNVVLGGLSQGCAASLIAALLWQGDPLGAIVGMCGWLPLADTIVGLTSVGSDRQCKIPAELNSRSDRSSNVHDEDNNERIIAEQREEKRDSGTLSQAVKLLNEKLDFPSSSLPNPSFSLQRSPVFLAHGTVDRIVPFHLGVQARDCLLSIGIQTQWMEEEGQDHWYTGKMLEQLISFLTDNGVVVDEQHIDHSDENRREAQERHHWQTRGRSGRSRRRGDRRTIQGGVGKRDWRRRW